ncbi:MAG: hypothetical protein ISR98_00065 [Parcubacteria group bacterium]|nr:hypothetical protein [Parcubacteria group bacterium]
MRKDKEKALFLRKSGRSYKQIKEELGIPVSTLSEWLSPHKWSQNIKKSLTEVAKKENSVRIQSLNNIRGEHLKKLYKEAEIEAIKEFEGLKYHPLFIAGIMIYWGEGDRVTKHNIRVSNTDPVMIKLFVDFLIKICNAPKNRIKSSLLLYPDLNDIVCKEYWSKNALIPENSFNKSIFITGKHKTKRLQYGVCNTVFTSTYTKRKLLIWLKLLSKEIVSKEYYKI